MAVVAGGMKLAGNVVWASKPRKVTSTTSGKGMPRPKQETTTYFIDLLIIFNGQECVLQKLEANTDTLLDFSDLRTGATGIYDAGGSGDYGKYNGTPTADAEGVISGTMFGGGGASFAIYPGNYEQLPDADYQADVGAANAPAFRGRFAVKIKDFNLSKYNGVPTFFATLNHASIQTVADMAIHLARRVGIEVGDLDFSPIQGTNETPLRGLVQLQRFAPREAIEKASLPYGLEFYENVDGKLTSVYLGSQVAFTVDPDHLGAVEGLNLFTDNEAPSLIDFQLTSGAQAHREVTVRAYNPLNGYELEGQTAYLFGGDSDGGTTIDLPMTLTPNEAKITAERLLYREQVGRETAAMKLPPIYSYRDPTDTCTVVDDGITHELRWAKVSSILPGVVEVEAIKDDVSTYNYYTEGCTPGDFTAVGSGAAINRATGVAPIPYPIINGVVRAAVDDGAGGWYIGGDFSTIFSETLGNESAPKIAHLSLVNGFLANDGAFVLNCNGNVTSLLKSGTTLYVGGDFTSIGGSTRNRLAAIDLTTNTVTSWNPNINGRVEALILDGTTLYIGGHFTTVNGATTRNRVAALSTSTGTATSFNPNLSSYVEGMLLSGTKLYVGGNFATVGGTSQPYCAAINTSTGLLDTTFAPVLDDRVLRLAIYSGILYLGGRFLNVNGLSKSCLAAVSATTGASGGLGGASIPYTANNMVSALAVVGDTLYVGGHFNELNGSGLFFVEEMRNRLAAFHLADDSATGVLAGQLSTWNPDVIGDWSATLGGGDYVEVIAVNAAQTQLYIGGEYNYINSDEAQRHECTPIVTGGSSGSSAGAPVVLPRSTTLVIIDAVNLRDADTGGTVYLAASPSASSGTWSSASILRDSGSGYAVEQTITDAATIGTAVNALATGSVTVFDESNFLDVDLVLSDTLTSASQLEVLNGANSAALYSSAGWEIFQFKTAAQPDATLHPRRWRLSGLLRGRKGSDFAVGSHAIGNRFVLLDAAVVPMTVELTARGVAQNWKAVTSGQVEADASAQAFTWEANNLKPLSVVDVVGARDGSNNLTITWKRRSRVGGAWMDGTDVALGEESERYEVDIMSGVTVLRTIAITSESATYSAANQTSDGLTPGNAVTVNVYQLSASVGRGFVRAATI